MAGKRGGGRQDEPGRIDFGTFRELPPPSRRLLELVAACRGVPAEGVVRAFLSLDLVKMGVAQTPPGEEDVVQLLGSLALGGWLVPSPEGLRLGDPKLEEQISQATIRGGRMPGLEPAIRMLDRKDEPVTNRERALQRLDRSVPVVAPPVTGSPEPGLKAAFQARDWAEYERLESEARGTLGTVYHEGETLQRLLRGTVDPALLASMPRPLRERAAASLVTHDVMAMRPMPAILRFVSDWARDERNASPALRVAGALAALVQGAVGEALEILGRDEDERCLFMRGRVRFFAGDIPGALADFERCLPGSFSAKEAARFGNPSVPFYVLSLLASRDPSALEKAIFLTERLREASIPRPGDHRILGVLAHQLAGHEVNDSQRNDLFRAAAMDDLNEAHFQAITLARMEGLPAAILDAFQVSLGRLVQRTREGGLMLYTAEFAEVLSVIDPDSPTAPHHRRLAGEFRTRTAIPSTFQTIPWTMAWERRLEELIGLGTRLGSDPSGEVGAERLVWIVAGAKHEGLSLTATIQKKSKQGNWSPGRVIPVEQLLERSPSDPLLSEQDRSVIAQLARPQAGHPRWGPSRAAPAPVLAALLDLVGHPRVYLRSLRQDRPAQVVRGEPRLDIGKQKDHLLVSMHPVVTSAEERQLVDLSDPGRIVMYDLGAPQSRIGAIVGEGLRIPLSAETKVLEALRVIGPYVPVHSDVGDDLEDVEEVLADSRLHVLLSRAKVGILVTIRVQPFGERGPLELPGVGGRIMTSTFEGHRARTRRDPGVEREAYQELLARCPSLGETESTRGEWELSDLETALEFLSELEAIRENLVVSWPEGEAFLVGRTLEAQSLSLTLRERKDYFSLTGELVIDEQTVINITDVLKALEEAKGRFLPLGDGRFVALSRDLARRLADLEGLSASSGASLQIHPLMALVLEGLFAKAGTLEGDRAWKARLDRMREAENLVAEVPASLGTDLRSYQVEGFQWMARLAAWGAGTCLADDMGLGKTIQALAMLLRRASGGPALIVAPTSVVSNWLDEMRKFAPSLTPRVLSTGAEASETGKWGPRDVTIVSYALLSNAIETLARSRWHTLILDEAQSIKNSETVRFKAAVRLEADWKCALTGTPIENHLGELWSLFRFLNPGLLGSLETFRDRYAIPIEKDGDREAQARLRRLVTPFVLRRTKNQVLQDLPPRTDIVRKVSFEPEERAFYEAVRRGALERLGSPAGEDQRIRILAEIMKLRRACCHPRLILPESGIPSSKLRAFEEIVEELIEGKHRSLVFSQFVGHLALLKEALDRKGIPHEYLDGSTPMAARRTAVESFQDGTAPFFLISLKAGGLGLNLTAADYVIHMDPWWNPAVEDQASDRAHRIGQTRPVTIYRIVAEDTIEEKILELHHRKRNLADRLFEGAEQAQALSVDELMGLLREESQGS